MPAGSPGGRFPATLRPLGSRREVLELFCLCGIALLFGNALPFAGRAIQAFWACSARRYSPKLKQKWCLHKTPHVKAPGHPRQFETIRLPKEHATITPIGLRTSPVKKVFLAHRKLATGSKFSLILQKSGLLQVEALKIHDFACSCNQCEARVSESSEGLKSQALLNTRSSTVTKVLAVGQRKDPPPD